jgi:hypothetical protein
MALRFRVLALPGRDHTCGCFCSACTHFTHGPTGSPGGPRLGHSTSWIGRVVLRWLEAQVTLPLSVCTRVHLHAQARSRKRALWLLLGPRGTCGQFLPHTGKERADTYSNAAVCRVG